MALALGLAAALLVLAFWLVRFSDRVETELESLREVRASAHLVASEFRARVGVLTEFARQYLATGDAIYLRYYETEVAIQEGRAPVPPGYSDRFWYLVMAGALTLRPEGGTESFEQRVGRLGFTPEERAELALAVRHWSQTRLVEQAVLARARASRQGASRPGIDPALHDEDYVQLRAQSLKPLDRFLESVEARAAARGRELLRQVRLSHFGMLGVSFGLAALLAWMLLSVRRELMRPLVALDGWNRQGRGDPLPTGLRSLRAWGQALGDLSAEVRALQQDREQMVRALAQADARFRRIGAQVRDVVFECRLDGVLRLPRFSYVSERASDVLGVDAERLLAEQDWLERALVPEDLQRLREAVDRALWSGADLDLSLRIRQPGQSGTRWVHLNAVIGDRAIGRHRYAGVIRRLEEDPQAPACQASQPLRRSSQAGQSPQP